MVLGRGTDHRRPADVDLFDAIVKTGTTGDRLGERVQVRHHEVHPDDVVLVEGALVLRLASIGEDSAVDARVQCLHTTIEDLGKPGDVGDLGHGHARGGDGGCRRAGGDDLDPGLVQCRSEFLHARLVVDRDECPAHRHNSTFRPFTVQPYATR